MHRLLQPPSAQCLVGTQRELDPKALGANPELLAHDK